MKKFLTLLLAMMMIMSLAACGGSDAQPAPSDPAPSAEPAEGSEPTEEEKPDAGDKQAVIDAFNATSTAFDALSAEINANPEAYDQQTIDVMTQMANSLLQCKEVLDSGQELTAEQADTLINTLTDIEAWVADAEAALAAEAEAIDRQYIVDYYNAVATMFDAAATTVNENPGAYDPALIDTMTQLAGPLQTYKAAIEGGQEFTAEEANSMIETLGTIEQWLLEVESEIFG